MSDKATSLASRSSNLIGTVNERKLVRKLDWRILPVLTTLYVVSFIDRVNIGNASLFGLQQDLGLSSNQYSIVLSVFFITYCLFEPPANLWLKKLRPPVFLAGTAFCFGLIVMGQGFCQNFGSLLAVRLLLGAAEAGTLPGCLYVISMWYRREEAQRRFSLFYSGASLAGAFSGLLASAIGNLDYQNGHRGWRWIFWIEGTVTCGLAIMFYFLIPDFPESTKWLTEEERALVVDRLKQQQGKSEHEEPITVAGVLRFFRNPHVIPTSIMYFGPGISLYGLAYFSPTIIAGYGFTTIRSQLFSVPPWVATFVFSMLISYLSDKSRLRFPFIIVSLLIGLSGCVTLLNLTGNTDARYACLVLYLMGVASAGPLIVCWNIMNLEGHVPRAVGAGWQVGVGNLAGIVSTWAFPARDAPRYPLGYGLGIGGIGAGLLMAGLYIVMLQASNKRRRADGREPLFL